MIYSKCCFNITDQKKACFLLTRRCNFKCNYCFAECNNHDIGEFTFEKVDEVIKVLRNKGIKYLVLSGGEPLLYKDIYKLVKKLVNERFEISMCTNAFFATDAICKRLYSAGLRKVTISFDEFNNKNFESITRVKGSYASVVKGIETFISNSFDVTINSVVYCADYDYIEQIVSFAQNLGVNQVCFTLPVCKSYESRTYSDNEIYDIYNMLKLLSDRTNIIIEFNNPQCHSKNCPSKSSIWGIDIHGKVGGCLAKHYLEDDGN